MPGVYLAATLGGAAVSHHEAAPHETRIFEAERQTPKVSGFGEFMGVPDRSVERFLAILPPGLLSSDVASIDFYPKEIPDRFGRVSMHRVPPPGRKPLRPNIIGGDNTVLVSTQERTSRIRISTGSLFETGARQDLTNITALPPAFAQPDVMRPHRVFSVLMHELVHALPDNDLDYYQARVVSDSRCRFPYPEAFLAEAGTGPADWRGMANEYRSEFALVLLTEVEVAEGERFEDAAVRHLLRTYARKGAGIEPQIRADVRHFMRTVAPDEYPWDQRIPMIRRGINRLSAIFHLNRFRRMYVERVSDPELRASLDAVLMTPPDRIPPARREMLEARDPRSRGEARRELYESIRLAFSRSLHELRRQEHPHRLTSAFLSWRLVVESAIDLSNDGYRGDISDVGSSATPRNDLSMFEAEWAALSPHARERLRPHLLRIVRACNGEKA